MRIFKVLDISSVAVNNKTEEKLKIMENNILKKKKKRMNKDFLIYI